MLTDSFKGDVCRRIRRLLNDVKTLDDTMEEMNIHNEHSMDKGVTTMEMTGLIPRIKSILGEDQILTINIYTDEIVFLLWEVKIPIVYNILAGNVGFKPSHLDRQEEYIMNASMLYDMTLVIEAIEMNTNEIRSWVK